MFILLLAFNLFEIYLLYIPFLHIVQLCAITVCKNCITLFLKLYQIIYDLGAKNVVPSGSVGSYTITLAPFAFTRFITP